MNFRSFVLIVTVAVSALGVTSAQTAAKKKTTAAKKTSVSTAKKGARGKAPVKRAGFQPRQVSPTPDRLREIQGALAAKGYLKSEPTGVWDAQSVDAMKRYQADQKQDPSGKITAASLIGLGLGPHTANYNGTPPTP